MRKKKAENDDAADLRFRDTVPLGLFRKKTIGIAGLGATGRHVALLLAAMGHKKLWGADPDKIEVKNIGTQGWAFRDIGEYKSDVLGLGLTGSLSRFAGFNIKFENVVDATYRASKTDIFFCCVDTMRAREAIWHKVVGSNNLCPTHGRRNQKGCCVCDKIREVAGNLQGLWIDSRLASRVIRIITIPLADEKARAYYAKTLYTDAAAFQGSCTDRMTIYGAYVAAGLMVSQMVNWLKAQEAKQPIPLTRDFVIETITMGMTRI